MRTIKLFAAVTTTAAGIVSWTVPRNCNIYAIEASGMVTTAAPAAGVYAQIELSKTNVNQGLVNPAEMVQCELRFGNPFTTSGGMQGAAHVAVPGIKCPLRAGEVLYINATVNGTITVQASFLVWIDD
jgi:hypothetical protein